MSESSTKSAVVVAILTGIFTVVAGLVTYYLTTKEPKLTYTVVGSPALSSPGGVKRIFVAEVVNTGRKEISDVLTRVAFPGGELSEIAYETSPGIKVTRSGDERKVELKADMLNPGDFVRVSFLSAGGSAQVSPSVVVRAPGVKGALKSSADEANSSSALKRWLPLAAMALAAVFSTFGFSTSTWLVKKVGVPQISSPLKQAEVSAFACGACQLPVEAERLRFGGTLSYRGVADYLFLRARSESPEKRKKYSLALQCLLLNDNIADASLLTIRQCIALIDGAEMSESEYALLRERAVSEGAKPLEWRRRVLEHADAGLARLNG